MTQPVVVSAVPAATVASVAAAVRPATRDRWRAHPVATAVSET
ncbi:hypothetical protein [Mycolicibacter arupensis]|nr:hypothetical protein [Mycolicibacter arupensis]